MSERIRQVLVVVFAISDLIVSLWLGSSIDQARSVDPTPVYFLPTDGTFAIWGVIFSSALFYAIYQALPAQREKPVHKRIRGWVALNGALTALWMVFAKLGSVDGVSTGREVFVTLTVFVLAGMLFSMTKAFMALRNMNAQLSRFEQGAIVFPVTVFFAWLNVAAIANTTGSLDALGFTGEPYGAVWATGMLVVATVLACVVVLYSRSTVATITYASVIIWAVLGIYLNNIDRSVLVAGACIASAVVVGVLAFIHVRLHRVSGTQLRVS
jgi:hypothetical protein